MSTKKKHRSANEYLRYRKGELSHEERHSFEKDLQADSFEMDALEGMEQFSTDELEEDILSLHSTLRKRLQRRRRRTFYYAAASVASLLIVGTIFLNIYNINPKSASESIPKDESFLHENVAEPVEALKQVDAPKVDEASSQEEAPIKEKRSTVEPATPVPSETRARAADRVVEDAVEFEDAEDYAEDYAEIEKVSEEAHDFDAIIVEEDKALQAAEGQRKEVPVEALAFEEAEAPVPEADELVVREAQPKRAQKKGRAMDAPTATSSGRVSGIVVSSEDMEPLPGASIKVKGSDSGHVADMEGRFSLVTDQAEQTTVIASFVGMETEEYQLSGGKENQVVMQPDIASLDEVVVIGYEADKLIYPSGAEPEGGLEAYKMYIEEHIRFPAGDTTSQREVVVLKFNVESDGSISQIKTLRSPGDSFTREALRLLNEGPSWNPAKNESGATDDVVRMRIVFKK